MREPGIARAHLQDGHRKPDLGRTAHSWRAEDAWLRYIRANRAALDEKSAQESRTGKAMGGLSEKSS